MVSPRILVFRAFIAGGLIWLCALNAQAQIGFEQIRSFGFPEGMGELPSAGLIEGSDGRLYGSTVRSGTNGDFGVVFRMERDGTGYTALHQFSRSDGAQLLAPLAEGPAGVLYGTTYLGGDAGAGTVFKIRNDGSGFEVLHHFSVVANDGANPQAGILVSRDGKLYGVTRFGGMFNAGTLYKMNADGSDYTVFYQFSIPLDGRGGLIEIDNRLYGTSGAGGPNGQGTAFGINKDGSDLVVLRSFNGSPTDGSSSWAALLHGSDGALYGTSPFGGAAGHGTIFKVNTNGSGYEVLHHFGGSGDGQQPWAALVEAADGKLYGTARNGGRHNNGIAFRLNKDGIDYEVLHHFNGGVGDGYRPEGTLLLASDGTVYGTTSIGGVENNGTVYRLEPDGSGYATLRSFSRCGGDASESLAGLLAASDGYLYGTTDHGGAYDFGTIFRIRHDGSQYRLLHHFDFRAGDGVNPYERLIEGSDGMLYGATRYGGGMDVGAIFKLNKDGTGYTIIHRFTTAIGGGRYPTAGVIQGSDGKLYGRTITGGQSNGFTIFSLDPGGNDFRILYDAPVPNGSIYDPYSNLMEGSDGALYGSSYEDGNDASGTVFKINKDGTAHTVLHHFDSRNGDGYYPVGGILQASDGKLYGTTTYGGALDSGILFRLNQDGSGYEILHEFDDPYYPVGDLHEGPGGTLFGITYFGGSNDSGTLYIINRDGGGFAVLHSFSGLTAGEYPNGTVIRGPDRGLYGTTTYGGLYDCGCIFRIAPITLNLVKEASGYRVRITGTPGQRYAIERASTLSSGWTEIGTAENITGTAEFLDPSPTGGQKFYRCRLMPLP